MFVVVGTTVLVVPFCVTVHVKGSAVVMPECTEVVLSVKVSGAPPFSEMGVGDGSVAVTSTVGRLEPIKLLITSEGTIDPGRTVTLPAASVAEKRVSSLFKFPFLSCCCLESSLVALRPPTA